MLTIHLCIDGMTDDRLPTFVNGVPTDGRFLALKLVTDGMKL